MYQPAAPGIEVYDGTVILRGTVTSFAQRRAAVADARRTAGASRVGDELEVRPLGLDRRKDAEIRVRALQRLICDSELPGRYVDLICVYVLGWVR